MTNATSTESLKARRSASQLTPSDLKSDVAGAIAAAMNAILADVFALYLKTKNFHWHMSGPHFRDYHVLLDEQSEQIYAMTDPIAERIRNDLEILAGLAELAEKYVEELHPYQPRAIVMEFELLPK